ncbi:hypothetical protein ACH5RR_025722 [Cinchona calisaya]|uniref:Uncharacterized protein n=1 Tax=Cinchona calisaya TaxID=153742 RepID=A0ABD2Z0H2_9GENT
MENGIPSEPNVDDSVSGEVRNEKSEIQVTVIATATRNSFAIRKKDRLKTILSKQLNATQIEELEKEVSEMEIRNALFAMKEGKSPGPDGFTVDFYTRNWESLYSTLAAFAALNA